MPTPIGLERGERMDLVSREEVLKTLWGIVPKDPISIEQAEMIFSSIRERIKALPRRDDEELKNFKLRLIKFILEDEVDYE